MAEQFVMSPFILYNKARTEPTTLTMVRMLPREIEYSNIIEGPKSRKTRDLIFIQASS